MATDPSGAEAMRSFYVDRLGLPVAGDGESVVDAQVGPARMSFRTAPAGAAPFYHFALLVPGDRFDAAHRWLTARTETLGGVAEFENWDALACYFLDPAGNIVELVAHRGEARSGARGSFDPAELAGFSEVGIVVDDKVHVVEALERELALRAWDGDSSDPGRLVFVGRRAHTLILSPRGRGWLPTRRPAEAHPLDVVVAGAGTGQVEVPGTAQRVRGRRRARDLAAHPPRDDLCGPQVVWVKH